MTRNPKGSQAAVSSSAEPDLAGIPYSKLISRICFGPTTEHRCVWCQFICGLLDDHDRRTGVSLYRKHEEPARALLERVEE